MIIGIYLAILLASFLGLAIGILLSNMTNEEVTHVTKYLKYLNLILPSLIVLISTYKLSSVYSIVFTIALFILLILFRKKNNDAWIYSSMGALVYISIISQETLNVVILVFIYGISISTINVSKYFKNKTITHIKSFDNKLIIIDTLKNYLYYFIVGILFFGVFTYLL